MGLSQIALYAFETALFWTVLEVTDSAVAISVLFSSIVLPVLVITVPVGVAVDRYGPRRLLLGASAAASAVIAVAAILAASSGLSFEAALVLALLEGVFFGVWAIPAQVLAGRLVDRTRMTSAIGLSALPTAVGSIVGGLFGGLLLQVAGAAPTFVAAAALLGLSALTIVGLPPTPGLATGSGSMVVVGQLRDAFGWARRSPVILAVIALAAAAGLFVMSRFSLVPLLVRDVLDAGPAGLGLMTMAGGIGSLLGSLVVDAAGRRMRRGPVLLTAFGVAGVALATLGIAPVLGVALILAGSITMSMVIYQVTSMTLLQVLAPPRMRGRAVAMYDMVRLGLVPVGAVLAGLLVPALGVSGVYLIFGAATVAAVAVAAIVCRPLVLVELDASTMPGEVAPVVTDASPAGPG